MLELAHKSMEEVVWSDEPRFHVHHVDRQALHGQTYLQSNKSMPGSGCTSLLFCYRGKMLWVIPLQNSDQVMRSLNICMQKNTQK